MQTIGRIVVKCLEVVVAGDNLEMCCRESGSLVAIVARIVGHLCEVLSKTLLLPQSREIRVRAELVRKVMEVLKMLVRF